MRNSDSVGPGQVPSGGGRVTNWRLTVAAAKRFFYVCQDIFGWCALVLFLGAFVACNAGFPWESLAMVGIGAVSLLGAVLGTEA